MENEVCGKCEAVLAVRCDVLDAFEGSSTDEDEEGDGEYEAMPHPVVNAIAAGATQDTGTDVVWGWANAGVLVVGAGVGPRGFTWHVCP